MRRERITPQQATQQAEDERWQCRTCSAPADQDDVYCACCRAYWADARDGLIDDDEWSVS